MRLEFAPNIYRVNCNRCLSTISFTFDDLENNGSNIKSLKCPNCNKLIDILLNDELNSMIGVTGCYEIKEEEKKS